MEQEKGMGLVKGEAKIMALRVAVPPVFLGDVLLSPGALGWSEKAPRGPWDGHLDAYSAYSVNSACAACAVCSAISVFLLENSLPRDMGPYSIVSWPS